MIEWFAKNAVAANLLMIGILVFGIYSASRFIPLEIFPSFELDLVNIQTSFRGATPNSVEDGITLRIEEAIYDLEGIAEVSSRSSEGVSLVSAEVAKGYDKRDVLDDIKLRVDALNTLPQAAEKTIISLIDINRPVIDVTVSGNIDNKELRQIADRVRLDILDLKGITDVELSGVANYEIAIEIDPSSLKKYQLSLSDVANAIDQGSIDLSAGNLKTRNGDVLIRTNGQAYSQAEYANIPVISNQSGRSIRLGDIAVIRDAFEEKPLITRFNQEPAIILKVSRTGKQSAITVAEQVRDYLQQAQINLPKGVSLSYWDDDSQIVKARLSTLFNSAVQGGILVLLLLSLFLRPAIAFWVFLGIPVSFMGAFIFMPSIDGSFNLVSLFAFILVLGIVVDDAIVTGENIYRHMRRGDEPLHAAIQGTKEIAVPVTFGILTTVVAFTPLASMEGSRMAILAGQIPMVVIPVLLFSLIESKLILPAHLSRIKQRRDDGKLNKLSGLQQRISRGFENVILKYYEPALANCLNNKAITLASLFAVSIIIFSFAVLGHLRFTMMPRVESETVHVSLSMPDTTGFETTTQHIDRITDHVYDLQDKYRDPDTNASVIQHILTTSGSAGRSIKPSLGRVSFELTPTDQRTINIKATQLANELRQRIGEIPGAEKLSIRAELGRGGEPIDIQLTGTDTVRMGEVVALLRDKLRTYPDVFDIQDNFTGGKEEFLLSLTPRAYTLGLTLADVARQVRQAFFGLEAQRIQRGRDELRVMVRYPLEHRSNLDDLYSLDIAVANSSTPVPLSDIATITPTQSPANLYRLNRSQILNVSADIDKRKADLPAIIADLKAYLTELIPSYPGIKYGFKGEAEEQAETNASLSFGLIMVVIAIYSLLAIPFKSYWQPFIVMSIIPFSVIGAIIGHLIIGINLSMLSMMGMLALTGVVVNDSLVLVDYINKQRKAGVALKEAVLNSGSARFRPVMLTSLTTFAGLTPLLLDQSTQAKFLVPMAVSLGFGILFATVITLIIIPVNYLLAYQLKAGLIEWKNRFRLWLYT